MVRLKEDRSYWLVVLLRLIPFGFIYGWWFQYDAIKSLNIACGRKEGSNKSRESVGFIVYLLLNYLTLGIFGLYWVWTQGQRMTDAGRAYGIEDEFIDPERKSTKFIIGAFVLAWMSSLCYIFALISIVGFVVIFTIMGLGLTVALIMSLIAYNKFFTDLNTLCRAYNKEISGRSPVEAYTPAPIVDEKALGIDAVESAARDIEKDIPSFIGVAIPGGVAMVTGEYAGSQINLRPGETIVIGRDPKRCALVCKSGKISRVHLTIQMSDGAYLVTDTSTNGTISSSSGRLPKDQPVLQYSGTTLKLGQSDETIRLL